MHFRVLKPLLHVAVLPQEDGLLMFSCHCGSVQCEACYMGSSVSHKNIAILGNFVCCKL